MKRAVIYTRVSRDDTGEGQSNQRQERECRRLTDYKRLDVVAVEQDISVSAFSGKERPAWKRVLDMVRAGEVDYVIAYHMDRMTRSMTDLEELIVLCEEHGVGIATAVGEIDLTSDMGRMVARILAAVARAEVERKSARQKLANAQRAAEGKPHSGGQRPFGYARDHMTVVEDEAVLIKTGAERALAGEPLISISKDWGMTARGVKNVLTNPRYAGIRMYLGERVGEAEWPAILDLEVHLRLVEALTDPARTKGTVKMGRTPTSLLTGLAACSVCKGKVRGSSVRGRLTYACRSSHAHIDRADVDTLALGAVINRLSSPAWVETLAPAGDDRLAKAKLVAEEKREALKMYARLLASGAMDEEQFTEASRVARDAMKEAEQTLSQAADGAALSGLDLGTDRVEKQLLALPLARQRGIVEQLLTIEILPQVKSRLAPLSSAERVIIS
ncbi:serine integrase [Streptomyces phage Leviticus]|uniref:Serine integrase n=2 Tax=Likavirus aaronocolus TaxID=1982884 RepID=A0A514U382_9CAUD|nr:serine integrase [Streptomyces phage Bovely]QDK03414.1 serine integrase [Streptomyces phage Leviticus]